MDNYGIISILPIVVTIGLSLKFRSIVPALFGGSYAGILIMQGFNPIAAMDSFVKEFLVPMITDTYSAEVLVLLLFINGFVKLLETSGGAKAFAVSVSKGVNSRFKAQLSAWLAGFVIFFSDIGSPIIVGPIFQSLFDRLRVSREKLAWIIDTTASPMSVLIPFLGWGAYIMGLMGQEFAANGLALSEWDTLLSAFPFQLYSWLCLFMVPMVALSGKEFGAMRAAELRVQQGPGIQWEAEPKAESVNTPESTQETTSPKATPPKKPSKKEKPEGHSILNARPLVMIIPLAVMLITLVGMLGPKGFPFKPVDGDDLRAALITGFLFGAVANILLCRVYRIKPLKEAVSDYITGMEEVAGIFIVLLLAWVLGGVTKAMGAPEYIVQIAEATVPAWFLPAVVFLASAIISFATGSSWGTFAIMLTIAIPTVVGLDANMAATVGAVLSGGLFGDHCSPISDTTVLSGTGAGCDLLDHVITQLPYAILCGVVAFAGYIMAGLSGGSVIVLPITIVLLAAVFMIVVKIYGKQVENTRL